MDAALLDLEARCGPVLSAPSHDAHRVDRRLERAWARGEVVRLVPGRFTSTVRWRAAAPWDRAVLTACVAASRRGSGVVVTGATAALLHGLWTGWTPTTLEIRADAPGHRGVRPPSRSFAAPAAAAPGEPLLPAPPSLRWRTRAGWTVTEPPVDVTARLADGTVVGRVRADSTRTLLATAGACLPLPEALPILDSLAARWEGDVAGQAAGLPSRAPTGAARRRLDRALAHVEPASESAGESLSRGLILELGFARPVIQREHRDADGRFIARTDFWWEEVGAHPDEASRRRAIRAEKEREVAVMQVVRALPRWTWADLREPHRLARILERHGVPRAARAFPRRRSRTGASPPGIPTPHDISDPVRGGDVASRRRTGGEPGGRGHRAPPRSPQSAPCRPLPRMAPCPPRS